jgi:ABC-2 type transport system ATP-binding protein
VSVTAEAAVSVEGLSKTFEGRAAVDRLSFRVPVGSVCGFVGPNGAGKTTTLRVLLGLVRPSAGSASVLGQPIDRPERYLDRVGSLIEGPAFYPPLSGRRNLQVLARLGQLAPSRVDAVLEQVGLAERASDRYRAYSLGMKQRLGIAAALLREPELLVLDEPMNGLDPAGMREIRGMLCDLADRGVTVLVSSHLLDELQQVSQHLIIIRAGRLVFEGSVAALLASQRPGLIARPENPADLVRLADLCAQAGYATAITDAQVRVAAPPSWAGDLNRQAMAAGIALVRLTQEGTRLEDVFFDLTEAR